MTPAAMHVIATMIYLLASIIQGEAGDVCGPQGRMGVAQVMATLHQDGHSWQDVAMHFYGRAIPDDGALRLASELVWGEIGPSGYRFMLSNQDMAHLHIRARPAWHVDCHGGLGLNFYREWPGS